MKKLLAVMLVLGLASVASAAVITEAGAVYKFNDTEDGIVSVIANAPAGYIALIGATGKNPIDGATGQLGNTNGFGYGHLGEGEVWGIGTFGLDPAAGTLFMNVDYAALPVQLYLVDGAGGAELQSTIVPEPMTMSLLGLGGLALIRRRRA